MTSDLVITCVEAIYLRLPQVKAQCDSGQDALLVRVTTDAGIVGYGEVDSNPMAAKGPSRGRSPTRRPPGWRGSSSARTRPAPGRRAALPGQHPRHDELPGIRRRRK